MCEHITFSLKRHPNSDKLKLHKTDIPRADSIKYLGVTLDPKLIWHSHVNKTAAKANSTLGFIRRNVLTKSQEVEKTAYQYSSMRPVHETLQQIVPPTASKQCRGEQPV